MRSRHLFFLLALFPVLGVAQTKLQLDFGSAGEREIWISDKFAPPNAAQKSSEATYDLPLSGGKEDRIFVWDRKSGNLASRKLGELGPVWKLAATDFSLTGLVTVRVEHDGKPVSVAFVGLKDGASERQSQIDPSKKGSAQFFGVKPGTVDIVVRYNVNGKDAEPVKQSVILNTKRTQADPVFIVSLTEDVETVGGAKTSDPTPTAGNSDSKEPTTDEKAKAPETSGGSLIGNAIVYLLGLGAAGAGIYFGLRYMKQNQEKVAEQLKKVGVQIPDPQDPSQQDPGAVPVPVAPAPPQKIILDDADPNVPIAPIAPISSTVTVSQPSLIMENGDVFPIPDGESSVGREASNALALVTETTVSRKHATFLRQSGQVTLRDEGSSNGTYVNGVKVSSDTVLRPGDQVQFGQARFRYEA